MVNFRADPTGKFSHLFGGVPGHVTRANYAFESTFVSTNGSLSLHPICWSTFHAQVSMSAVFSFMFHFPNFRIFKLPLPFSSVSPSFHSHLAMFFSWWKPLTHHVHAEGYVEDATVALGDGGGAWEPPEAPGDAWERCVFTRRFHVVQTWEQCPKFIYHSIESWLVNMDSPFGLNCNFKCTG